MKKIITICLFAIAAKANVYGIVRVSAAGAGPYDYNTAASWVPAGVPTSSDIITINAGTTMTLSAAGRAKSITIDGTISWLTNTTLQIWGTYTLSATGTEVGAVGQLAFVSAGNIVVNGACSPTIAYRFQANRTITAGSVINKVGSNTYITSGQIVTNLGNFTMGASTFQSAASKWINSNSGVLTLTSNGFTSAIGLFDASPSGNQVILSYAGGNIPNTLSGYSNLILTGAGSFNLLQNTIVGQGLTINSGATLNSNSFDISIGTNWVNNGTFTPTANHSVTFNGVTALSGTGSFNLANLIINAGATLNANNKDISLIGNFTNNGTFTASAGHFVLFNGTTAQTISSSGTTVFEQLSINNTNGVSLSSGTYFVNDVLTNNNGLFQTNGNNITLISTAGQTARIAPVTGTGAFSGNFTINRFITARDTTWADLASPVQASIFNDWDNELPAISYVFSTTAVPTQFTYSEPADNYVPITSSGVSLTPGVGFEVYLSGDFLYNPFPATTLNTVGTPNYGNQNLTSQISFTGGTSHSNLVGNPFASSISWNSVLAASSNIAATYDVFDYTSGGYTTYGAGTEIGSTQGFWVYTTGAAPTLIVNENAKTNSSNSTLKTSVKESYFTLKISGNDANNSYSHILKVGASPLAKDGFAFNEDHPFHKSPLKAAPAIYTTLEGTKSVINVFNSGNSNYDMEVSTPVGTSGSYKIDASGFVNLSDYTCISLEDMALNKTVDLISSPSYSFNMNTTDDINRFVIHFSKNGDCKSMISNTANNNTTNNLVQVLPTAEGSLINFKFTESTKAKVSVTNLLGQTIIDDMNIDAFSQSVNVILPEGFSGMYLLKIESSNGVIVKKFVKK